jgi:hypothetical protein
LKFQEHRFKPSRGSGTASKYGICPGSGLDEPAGAAGSGVAEKLRTARTAKRRGRAASLSGGEFMNGGVAKEGI